jgi:hypothetical protein
VRFLLVISGVLAKDSIVLVHDIFSLCVFKVLAKKLDKLIISEELLLSLLLEINHGLFHV